MGPGELTIAAVTISGLIALFYFVIQGDSAKSGETQSVGRRQREEERRRGAGRHESQPFEGTYYERLGVEPDATREEIEEAWRRMDSGQYLAIDSRRSYFEAYRVLSDPATRRRYDSEMPRQRREKEQDQSKEMEQRWHKEQEQKRRHEQEQKRLQEQEQKRRREQDQKRRQEQEQQRRQEQEQKRRQEQEQDRYRSAGHQESHPHTDTYYERLGVELKASQREIKKAWRKFARNWHPDVCKNAKATVVFQSGNEAFTVLSEPELRRRYDSQLLSERREKEEKRQKERRRHRHSTERTQQRQYERSSQEEQEGRKQRASRNSQQDAKNRSAQNHNHGQHQRTRYNTHQGQHRKSTQNTQQNRSRHDSQSNRRHFIGTWARIKLGPWTGMWGAWIESLNVSEGDLAYIRRRDGRVCKVVVIEVLHRSYGKRVTLCRVQSLETP